MRTHLLFRGALVLAVALAVSAPAFAQGVVRGSVVDAKGQPIEGATVTFEAATTGRKIETKSDKKGEFLQVGLNSGAYKVTATKDKLTSTIGVQIKAGTPQQIKLELSPSLGLSEEEKKAQAGTMAAAQAAIEAMTAGRDDEAIAKFQEVIAKVPTCSDCYLNMGVSYVHKQAWPEAEAAFKKVIELKPTSPEAYAGLANVYNGTKRFDEAVAASKKSAELGGGASTAGGGNAEALYNQGVILFNAQKYAEAKVQFDAATKADPQNANAFYQLGMTSLNLGQIPDAVSALQTFMKIAPTHPKAAEVQASLPALQAMLPK